MKKPGKRFLRLIAVLVLTPPAIWLGVVFLLPMGWARDRVVASLTKSTRQQVRLEGVRLRPWGGIELSGLEIASPETPTDPWLKVAAVSVDGRLRDLVRMQIEPTACRASGVALRVRRDASGRLEFDRFDRRDAKPGPGGRTSTPDPGDDPEFTVSLDNARVAIVDEATDTRLDLADVHALATITTATIDVSDFNGTLNGGTFSASGTIDRAAGHSLAAEVHAQGVDLGVGMASLCYLVPLLATKGQNVHARGTLAIDAEFTATGDSSAALARSFQSRGRLALDGLTLDDSRILDEVQALLPVPTRGKIGALSGHFAIADRRVSTSDTVLKVADVPVNLAGWSDFDGRLDYLVKCETLGKAVTKLANRLPSEAREFLADLPMDDLASLTDVHVFGTINKPKVKSAGVAPAISNNAGAPPKVAAKKPDRRASDKAKLKEAAHRLLERALR